MHLPLPELVKRGLLETAQEVLDAGAFVNIDEIDDDLESGLFHCCCGGHFDLACLFLKHGATSNFINKFGSTPLHAAADNNYSEIVRLLLHHGADPNGQNFNGDTPCHLAASRGNQQIIEQFLTWGCDVTIKNDKQRTCVHEAEARGLNQMVRILSQPRESAGTLAATKQNLPKCKERPQSSKILNKSPVSKRDGHDVAHTRDRCPTCCQHLPPTRYYDAKLVTRTATTDDVTRFRNTAPIRRAHSSRLFEIDEQDSWEYVYVSPTERRANSLPAHGRLHAHDYDDDDGLVTK